MKTIVQVDLGERSYEIGIGQGLLAELGDVCSKLGLGKNCLVVTDDQVGGHHLDACSDSLTGARFSVSTAVIPHGEASKSGEQLFNLYDDALDAGLDRKAWVAALGGGVVGDLAGYLAGSYLRGIDYVQVPTSIVAMVDSAVGGKTGINLPRGKNLVGAFHQPRLVWADLDTLKTLPEREFISGLAEVVKYGVIRDAAFFQWLENNAQAVLDRETDALAHIAARSCEIKAEVVSEDEREGGLRAILNFGHTLGHAIENAADYGTHLHGEAISVGMVYAAMLSEKQTGFKDTDRLVNLLQRLQLPISVSGLAWPDLVAAMAVDKKVSGGVPKFVLADEIGKVSFGCLVQEELLEETWPKVSS